MYILSSSKDNTFLWELKSNTIIETIKDNNSLINCLTCISSLNNPKNNEYIISSIVKFIYFYSVINKYCKFGNLEKIHQL